jgi:lipid A oxidase
MRRHLNICLVAASALACETAAARFEISAYTGQAVMPDTKLEYRSGDDTQLTFSGVAWETKSLDSPIYYGFRLSHWRPHNPRLGIALDFTHPKAYLSPEQSVQVSGNRAGEAVDGQHTSEYQLAGPAVQGLAGVRYATSDRVGVFVEYKLSYARLDESLSGGGSIAFNPQIHQFVLGLSYGF